MKNYILRKSEEHNLGLKGYSCSSFDAKPLKTQKLINESLAILDQLGIPIVGKTPRKLEKMGLVFLALCNIKVLGTWSTAQCLDDSYALKTREIIDYLNTIFGENISRGSYDDIRRKDLKQLILAGIVLSDRPQSARNDPSRAWAINPEYIHIIRSYGQDKWKQQVRQFTQDRVTLKDQLNPERNLSKIPIELPSNITLEFGLGEHNQLQKVVIEQFLPRYGFGATLLYVGDAENKLLYYEESAARSIGLTTLAHGELPDIIAYSLEKNWLYLIEAVHSSGPVSPERILTLQPLIEHCTADTIFITAFLDRSTFRKFVADIAWETEVWIASSPDHLIHFNGDKFLGPYPSPINPKGA
ncbi:BsuBI/PstI family type II restriction endonuclease [Prochlorothrix hollandica]|uniref:BsuBI/PstI family type II restriction endonuclease n=1 Tax=Prochlorothrix hollandica TaxID=1223 RepID=UPI003342ABCD